LGTVGKGAQTIIESVLTGECLTDRVALLAQLVAGQRRLKSQAMTQVG
jgi:hypothetical protein